MADAEEAKTAGDAAAADTGGQEAGQQEQDGNLQHEAHGNLQPEGEGDGPVGHNSQGSHNSNHDFGSHDSQQDATDAMLQTLQDALLQQEDRMDRQERRHAQQLAAVNTEMHRLRFTAPRSSQDARLPPPVRQILPAALEMGKGTPLRPWAKAPNGKKVCAFDGKQASWGDFRHQFLANMAALGLLPTLEGAEEALMPLAADATAAERDAHEYETARRANNNRVLAAHIATACAGAANQRLRGIPIGDGITAWKRLLQIYQADNTQRMNELIQLLERRKLGASEHPSDYFAFLDETITELKDNGIDTDLHRLKAQVVNGLPSVYAMVRQILIQSKAIDYDGMKEAILMAHADIQHQRGDKRSSETAMWSEAANSRSDGARSLNGGPRHDRQERPQAGRHWRSNSGAPKRQPAPSRPPNKGGGYRQFRTGGSFSRNFQDRSSNLNGHQSSQSSPGRGGGGRGSGARDERRCYNCNKIGHLRRDCRSPRIQAMAAVEGEAEDYRSHGTFLALDLPYDEQYDEEAFDKCQNTDFAHLVLEEQEEAAPNAAPSDTVALCAAATDAEGDSSHWNSSANTERITFLVDSGASRHIIKSADCLTNIRRCQKDLVTADGSRHPVTTYGDLCGQARLQGGYWNPVVLKDVWVASSFTHNLLSTSQLMEQQVSVHWDRSGSYLAADSRRGGPPDIYPLLPASANSRLLAFDVISHSQRLPPTSLAATESAHEQAPKDPQPARAESAELWHSRLGHPGANILEEMEKNGSIKVLPQKDPQKICEPCEFGKSHRSARHKGPGSRATRPFELLHTDMWGPIRPTAPGGLGYAILYVDDFSRYRKVYLIKRKSDAASTLQQYITEFPAKRQERIGRIRADSALEYTSGTFKELCDAKGITQEFSAPYSQWQNGVAERSWRTLGDKTRAMMIASGLPASFWGHALIHATYLVNISPTTAVSGYSCPFEAFYNRKPDFTYLKVFGAAAYAHVDKRAGRTKLAHRAKKGFYLGVSEDSRTAQVWMPDTGFTVATANVRFDERGNKYGPTGATFDLLEQDEEEEAAAPAAKPTPKPAAPAAAPPRVTRSKEPAAAAAAPAPPPAAEEDADDMEEILLPQPGVAPEMGEPSTPLGLDPEPEFDPTAMKKRAEGRQLALKYPEGWLAGRISRYRLSQRKGQYDLRFSADAGKQIRTHDLPANQYNTSPEAEIYSWFLVKRAKKATTPTAPNLPNVTAEGEKLASESGGAAYADLSGDTFGFNFSDNFYDPEAESAATEEAWTSPQRNFKENDFTLAAVAAMQLPAAADPLSYTEAVRSPFRREWEEAAREEYDSLLAHKTFSLVPLPAGRKAVGSKWVFKTKRNAEGRVIRYKARLVAQGFSQKPGVDYVPDELSAPVARMDSIRTTLALAAHYNWTVLQMDVDTAYLNADVTEDIYMRQPQGFIQQGRNGQDLVFKLHRSLYGLKQSAFNWNTTISTYFAELGFLATPADPCVFSAEKGDTIVIIVLYVDDLLITGNQDSALNTVKGQISSRFKMKDLGEVSNLLGMNVTRNRQEGWLKIDQERYIQDILKRYNMESCHSTTTPATPGEILTKEDCAAEGQQLDPTTHPYRSIVGSLMYAGHVTRPDISNSVRILARYLESPGEKHWAAAKKCIRYLAGTKSLGITYRRGSVGELPKLQGFSDANWAGDLDNARSTTGVVFMLAGGAISFTSRLQQTVARSSMESEYMALYEAAQTAQQLRQLLTHLGVEQPSATEIFEDNEACATIANPKSYTRRSRHIDVRFHFTREAVENGIIAISMVSTDDQLADLLTKNLPAPRLSKLRSALMG